MKKIGLGVLLGFCVFFAAHRLAPTVREHILHIEQVPAFPMERHVHFLDHASKQPPKVVFLGDSITDYWCDYPDLWDALAKPVDAANFGIAGNGIADVRWRVAHGELGSPSIKVVVLLIGTNDLTADRTPAEIAKDLVGLADEIRQVPTHPQVVLMKILPRGQTAGDPLRKKAATTNALVSDLASRHGIPLLDLEAKLVSTDGSISRDVMSDGIHPAREGYRQWLDAVRPVLDAMLRQQK